MTGFWRARLEERSPMCPVPQ